MSVVIKGMKLPKNCLLCPCCVGEGIGAGRQHYCQAIEDEPCVSETYRPKNCPLVEIRAPHGRLIDADALLRVIEENSYRLRGVTNSTENGMFLTGIRQAIDESPTIIEAEK